MPSVETEQHFCDSVCYDFWRSVVARYEDKGYEDAGSKEPNDAFELIWDYMND